MMAFHSVRARLTVWYTAILALVLITFSGISYMLLARAIRTATDGSLADAAREFAAALHERPFERTAIARLLSDLGYSDRVMILVDATGGVVASSRTSIATSGQRQIISILRSGMTGYTTAAGGVDGDGLRIFVMPVVVDGARYTIGVARDLDEEQDRLQSAAQAVFFGIPIALIVAAAGGYIMARKSLEPVTTMSLKARQIGAETLTERITVANERDELGFLANTLNELLERLQRAFDSQRRFMADASHELRTPLAIIQGEADVALSRPHRSADEYRESIGIIQTAARKLTRIVDSLFLLARSDAGRYPITPAPFYLDELLSDCVRTLRTVAASRNIELACDAASEMLIVADEALIHRMVQNVVENALKFTPPGGFVRVEASRESDDYVVRVIDSGRGIPADERDLIFERFYRGRATKEASGSKGAGLGLPIARWIAHIHNGKLFVEHSDETGTTFKIVIPPGDTSATADVTREVASV